MRDRRPAVTAPRRADVLAVLALAAIALAFVAPALPGTGWTLGGDDALLFSPPLSDVRPAGLARPSNPLLADAYEVFHPDLAWAVGEVRAGRLPLWNPGVGGGWPQLASQQTALLSPLTLPSFVLGEAPARGLVAALGLFVAALGTFAVGRRTLGLGAIPAFVAAVAFSAGSTFVGWLEHPHHAVYAFLPWMLLLTDRVVRAGAAERRGGSQRAGAAAPRAAAEDARAAKRAPSRRRAVGLLALATTAALLGGHPQSAVICGALVVAFAVWRLATTHAELPRGPRAGGAVGVAAGLLLGGLGAAIVLLPLAEMLGQAYETSRAADSGLPPSALLTLALPDYWGRPDQAFAVPGPFNQIERTAYVGAPALVLTVGGLLVRRTPLQRFFLGATVAAALVALQVPGLSAVLRHVPVVSAVSLPRALIVLAFALAALAGLGLQELLRADAARRRRAVAITAMLALLPLLAGVGALDALGTAASGVRALPGVPGDPGTPSALVTGAALRWGVLAALALVILAWSARRRRGEDRPDRGDDDTPGSDAMTPSRRPTTPRARGAVAGGARLGTTATGALLAVLLVVDLLSLGRGQHPVTRVDATAAPAPPLLAAAVGAQGHARTTAELGQLVPNVGLRYGIRDLRLRGQPQLDRVVRFTGTDLATILVPGSRGSAGVLDLFGVTQVLGTPQATAPQDASLREVARTPTARLLRNVDALPRAYVATRWRPASGAEQAIARTRASSTAELRAAPVVEGASPGAGPSGGRPTGAVRFQRDDPGHVDLLVRSTSAGRLVLLDTAYPGWHASVDGREVAIAPTNGAFRSVPVPAGASRVTFAYRPTSVVVGAVISTLALLLALALAALPRRPRS